MPDTLQSRVIQLDRTGGPEVLALVSRALPPPGPGEVRIVHKAIGVNFVDTYHRSGLYPVPLPSGLGAEAAGIIEAIGPGVRGLKPGDRVAYATAPLGAYSDARLISADQIIKLPEALSFATAAAMMLRGLTAEFLLHRAFKVKPGDAVLVHAAAGGVGLILAQWARYLGARVIGVVGTPDKAALARSHGCHEILLQSEDIAARVRSLTGGAGVAAVYDGVGKDTFSASLDSLRPRGMLLTFGNASGPPPAIDPLVLGSKGSLFLTRPSLFHYCATKQDRLVASRRLFAAHAAKAFEIHIGQRFPLDAAADAHRALQTRATTGSTILIP